MDTLPLPPRPSLEQYRKRAKGLVAAAKSRDPDAVRIWASDWLGSLAKLLDVPITPFVQGSIDRAIAHIDGQVREKQSKSAPEPFTLVDAQFLIAQAHGFENWAAFVRHLEDASG